MVGFVVSRTVMVCTQLDVLPHSSVAVHLLEITLVPPQPLVRVSLKRIVTNPPQPSWAVARPVAFGLVSPGHSTTTFVGQRMVGALVSRTVMVCTQLALLPHWSVAVQVRAMTLLPPQPLVTSSVKPIVNGPPQPSCAVATPVTLVRVSAGHSNTRFVGQLTIGGVVSLTSTSAVQALEQPLLVTFKFRVKL